MPTTSFEPYHHPAARGWRADPPTSVIDFHRGLPGYAPTRLVELPALARELSVGRVFVKEESTRLGLPAFKVLGAAYAISRALSARVGVDRPLDLGELRTRLTGQGRLELVAATDGNHGRAVAHVAALLNLPARIFTPAGITSAAKAAIESEGATRVELALGYDDVVAAAAARATDSDEAVLIQDTSWAGYEQIPQWIVDGYGTLVEEADAQLAAAGVVSPDVVAVPVGVGSLAQCLVRHYRSGATAPSVVSVEPGAAPALLTSLHTGRPVTVPTGTTIMAGLNCGTPSAIGWPILRAGIDAAVAVADVDAARAVGDLEALGVDAGPCGAATLAGARAVVADGGLTEDAVVLLISTEGRAANPLEDESA